MPDATEIEMILCQATDLPRSHSPQMTRIFNHAHNCAHETLLQYLFFLRRDRMHFGVIDTFALRFVKSLKQTLPPAISIGGERRFANERQKPLIGV